MDEELIRIAAENINLKKDEDEYAHFLSRLLRKIEKSKSIYEKDKQEYEKMTFKEFKLIQDSMNLYK